ncbi:hypothetical protein LTR64_002897 [Lithohypha guttulata]|uniref:uncharacterized protein n=1 Tax=Lithohypha guttulata TaxID=1690604 RepID=UPI002DE16322|nr:hypothetical protein LTR51_000878 [Lithohypha guttulata]
MADSELATRAPESDLQEESLEDDKSPLTSKQTSSAEPQPGQAAQVSDHCTTDRPLPSGIASEAPSGTLSKWSIDTGSDVEVYVSKPTDYPTTPARLLFLLTNGTGVHSRNNQHQADLFARAGYLTIMPDLFAGDPAPNTKPEETPLSSDATWLDTVKLKVAETAKSFSLDMWLARHTEETVLPTLHGVLKVAREDYADAVSHGDGVYAVGYCFGGRYVLLLASGKTHDTPTGQQAQGKAEEGQMITGLQIKAGVCAHGTLVGRKDVQNIKAPIQLVCVEDDPLFPEDVLDEGRKSLEEHKIDHQIEVYKDVPHGFAVVGEYESQKINDAQSKAFDGMLAWLNAH